MFATCPRSDSDRAIFMLSFINSYNGNILNEANEEVMADIKHSKSNADVSSPKGVRRADARDTADERVQWGDSSRDGSRGQSASVGKR